MALILTNDGDKSIITGIAIFITHSTSINTSIISIHIIDGNKMVITCDVSWKHVLTTTSSIPTPTVQ